MNGSSFLLGLTKGSLLASWRLLLGLFFGDSRQLALWLSPLDVLGSVPNEYGSFSAHRYNRSLVRRNLNLS